MNPTDPTPTSSSPDSPATTTRKGRLAALWRNLDRAPRRQFAGALGFAVVLAAVFSGPLVSLFVYAAGTRLHSHIILIPFVSVYLIAVQRKDLPRNQATSPGWAVVPFVVGLAALAAAWSLPESGRLLSQNDYLALMAFSFVSFLVAGGFLFLGRQWMSAAAFPVAFLIFMVPLPDGAVAWLENASKLASAEAAALFFSLSGTPFLRDGTVFQLPGIVIEVAQECSGIRSSWVLFITGLLASHLFLSTAWRQSLLVAVVIPLGILRNGFRILVIGLLCVHVNPDMIHGIIHRRGGPLFFGLSLVPLFFLLWWLRRGETKNRRPARHRKLGEQAEIRDQC